MAAVEELDLYFSDGTRTYRSPEGPNAGDTIKVTVRVPANKKLRVSLILNGDGSEKREMFEETSAGAFSYYSCTFICTDGEVRYHFLIEKDAKLIIVQDGTSYIADKPEAFDPNMDLRFFAGFQVPEWSRGAVQYQIFVDRFCRGDRSTDVVDGEYIYLNRRVRHIDNWNEIPDLNDPACFYGGDLEGVLSKLDYLQGLGIEVIYMNPIFVSPSSHKYDTQDYRHIDPHFGVIRVDSEKTLKSDRCTNAEAEKYRIRTADIRNLEASDELFAKLCREIHRRGMHAILDGVFNHCGSFNRWMDREGIYGWTGAYRNADSLYRKYFTFEPGDSCEKYEGWWGYETLPKLNYDSCPELCEEIFSIAEKWLRPPYCVDGWRLDVAADLGHSPEVNHQFWKEFRKRVKAAAPDALIIAEHYGDASAWLHGDEWDTVMNYDAFMDPVSWYFTGLEKHSDHRRDDLYLNGPAFLDSMISNARRMGNVPFSCAMNELSNHDHSRFLTRTNGMVGRTQTAGPHAASDGISKAILRAAVMLQFTWPGCPTVYYGDEAGQVGWTDPDNRRTYPWGHEDEKLIDFHRKLARLRKKYPVLRYGSLMPISAEGPMIVYARFDRNTAVIIAINAGHETQHTLINVSGVCGNKDIAVCRIVQTDDNGYTFIENISETVYEGKFEYVLPPVSAVAFRAERVIT